MPRAGILDLTQVGYVKENLLRCDRDAFYIVRTPSRCACALPALYTRLNALMSRADKFRIRPKESPTGSRRTQPGQINDSLPFAPIQALSPAKVIDLFLDSFKFILGSEDLTEMVQVVKGELYQRDYLSAFNSDDKRFAYAARWSPSRALAYASIFASLEPITLKLEDPARQTKVLCVGGGAAGELVALASVFCKLKQPNGGTDSNLLVSVIDIADWSTVVGTLTNYVKKNWLYDPEKVNVSFMHGDVLAKSAAELELASVDLITLMFTTNELLCEKKAETIRLLQLLTACKSGSLLLITESAGSYSHITVGLKTFPVQFLIDTILLGKPGSDSGCWRLVALSDSCWYRINEREVSYPVKLENMRFFYRLYERC